MIFRKADRLILDDIFLEIENFVPNRRILLKLEQYQPTGSIKIKSALSILESMEERGLLSIGKRIIESSSGNFGIAMAYLCFLRGYSFTCIVDPNAQLEKIKLIKLFRGEVLQVNKCDMEGGYLGARLDMVNHLLEEDPNSIWSNQYSDEANAHAHEQHTAPSIIRHVPEIDVLVVGAGTTGTLLGCMRHFSRVAPHVRIVAADSIGSVTFGGKPKQRLLSGVGASIRPPLAKHVESLGKPDVRHVSELDTIKMCRRLLKDHGLFLGPSTGTVMCALERDAMSATPGACLVGISPDGGNHYLDTIYNDEWVERHFNLEIN